MSEYDFLKIFEAIINESEEPDELDIQKDLSNRLEPFNSSKNAKRKTIQQKAVDEEEKEQEVQDDVEQEDSEEEKESKITKSSISIEFDDFIDSANAMRASHSFGDKSVKNDLKTYYERLNKGEKQSLIVFLMGITEIAAADIDGDKVKTPHDFGITTSSISSTEQEVQNDSDQEDNEDKKEKDDKKSSSPIITVGESKQNTSEILRILEEIKKG